MSTPVQNLAERVPADATADALLEAFLEWTMDLEIELYPAQEEAVLEVMSGRHVILNTPTGSGKSLVAVALHFRGLCRGERSVYTSPIKALVSEKFFSLCKDFGADNVGMLTGDAAINRDAPILCCTAEVLANMALREGEDTPIEHVVMDEFHYYADRDRGMAWQVPLLVLRNATFLLMSATLGDMTAICDHIDRETGRRVSVVTSSQRPVPLETTYVETPIHETIEDLVRHGRAPIYVVNFSQREATEQAQALTSVNYCTKEEKAAIAAAIGDFRFDSPFGKDMRRYVRHGIGLHHAGLLPKYRRLVERLAQEGLLRVISGTDTLGVGVNVPIRTVLFTKLCKFDGEQTRILSVRDFQQIAGRAGRKGFDDQGWVMVQAPEHVIENKRTEAKAQGSKKKPQKRKPPTRGYMPWNRETFDRLVSGQPEPLTSVFTVDHSVLINLLQQDAGGYRSLVDLIGRCHEHPGRKTHLRREGRRLFKSLVRAGLVEVARREEGGGSEALVHEGLQDDFSLHHTLSLYLVYALRRLDQRLESYPLDVLSLVEAILESPRPILLRQVSRIKDHLVAEMKAEGIPYEERMERLEQVTWPKPNADFVYATFADFAVTHPWLSNEAIRPKSIARDVYERFYTFKDYVQEYGLERMEGVLLRYLSQAYKTLSQNVPEWVWTDEVEDVAAYLRALIVRIDSSLVHEWEALRVYAPDEALDALPEVRPVDVLEQPKAFAARVRAEMHRLIRAIATQDWEELSAGIRAPDAWPGERLQEALEPFFATYGRVDTGPRARLADKTTVVRLGPRHFDVSQVLCDPAGDDMWALTCEIDLRDEPTPDDGPLATLVRIGV